VFDKRVAEAVAHAAEEAAYATHVARRDRASRMSSKFKMSRRPSLSKDIG
jgi:hypothetical protein